MRKDVRLKLSQGRGSGWDHEFSWKNERTDIHLLEEKEKESLKATE